MNLVTDRLKTITRRAMVPVLAGVVAVGAGAYQLAKPAKAATVAAPAPAAAALDDNSVAPLLAFDQAMETLASHVTPAIVNVTVTSKTKAVANADGDNGD